MVEVRFFRDHKGNCPALKSITELHTDIEAKIWVRIEELEEKGHNLRRPAADILRNEIYELRIKHLKVHYRILYFFLGQKFVILNSLITKLKKVPSVEIDRCIANKKLVEGDFELYTYEYIDD